MATPVVLDTDIGTDIDDTWALGMLLGSPELDLRLVTTVSGDTEHRAALAARLLDVAGRSDVAVGVGPPGKPLEARPQAAFLAGYGLDDYPGPLYRDGVAALIEGVMGSEEPVTVIAIGPLTNVAEALRREPRIAERARLVGMHGSVRRGYRGSETPAAEYNVACDPEACRRAFAAGWEVTLTPLDSCGIVYLSGERYRSLLRARSPLLRAVVECYRVWLEATGRPELLERRTTTLFDTVAIQLALGEDLLVVEELGLHVDDRGFTRPDPAAPPLRIATGWRDLEGFYDQLVARLLGGARERS